jgi:ribosomal 50S subunit-associated protein YjgA (DUF615 family)
VISGSELADEQPPVLRPGKLDLPVTPLVESKVSIESLGDDASGGSLGTVVDTEMNVVTIEDDVAGFEMADEHRSEPEQIALKMIDSDKAGGKPLFEVKLAQEKTRHSQPIEVSMQEVSELTSDLISAFDDKAELARKNLLDLGPGVLDEVMAHFPGRLRFDVNLSHDTIPPVAEHSELLAYLVDLGRPAGLALMNELDSSVFDRRFYAVFALGEVIEKSAVERLAARLYDREAKIRLKAIEVLQKYKHTSAFKKLLSELRQRLRDSPSDPQAIAAALLGNFKDRDAVPALIDLVNSKSKIVARASVESLRFITKQDFSAHKRKWNKWWKQNNSSSRIRWLIYGLSSKNRDIRFSSAQELNNLTQEFFGYYFDSKKSDREKAVKRWEAWWKEKGCKLSFDC